MICLGSGRNTSSLWVGGTIRSSKRKAGDSDRTNKFPWWSLLQRLKLSLYGGNWLVLDRFSGLETPPGCPGNSHACSCLWKNLKSWGVNRRGEKNYLVIQVWLITVVLVPGLLCGFNLSQCNCVVLFELYWRVLVQRSSPLVKIWRSVHLYRCVLLPWFSLEFLPGLLLVD